MTTIEVGGEAVELAGIRKTKTGAKEVRERAIERTNQKPAIAKHRAERRAKGSTDVHAVDRGHGPSVTQQAKASSKIVTVDTGAIKAWRRAYSLPSFPDPPGFVLCYIARHKRRHGDDAGLLSSLREGWQFVRPEELDEDDLPTETFTGRLAKYGEVIGDETTVLMKLPEEFKAQRDAYYNGKRDSATRAVTKRNPGLDVESPAMPLVEDRNEVSHDFARMRARRPRADRADAADA
jgi:hypothetical protein